MQYDCTTHVGAVSVATSREEGVLQMTSECVLRVLIADTHVIGRSFFTIRNHNQWCDFVEGNIVQVQGLLDGKCNDWKAYSWNGAVWYFNIGGFVWLGHHMLFFRQGVEKLFLGKFYELKMCFFRLQTHVPFIVIKHLVHSAAAVTNLVDYCRALENKEGHTGTQLMIIMCCVVCMVLSCVLFLSVPSLV